MNKFFLFFSSVSKKIFMSLAGLFLISFLLIHLMINLLLLKNDGGSAYKTAVEFMTTNPVIKIMELFLFGGFILHIILGLILQFGNWMARPIRYKVEGYSHTSFFSKYMIHTGIVIGVFLTIHFMNFYFVKLGWVQPPAGVAQHDFYQMAQLLFAERLYAIIYVVMIIILGFHLNHAFQSAFQSLGLSHSKYTPVIRFLGTLYSIVVPLGFAMIPIYFQFVK
jgi:succinate dehydrogenase / fumarate reductase, cytochrome b subunit